MGSSPSIGSGPVYAMRRRSGVTASSTPASSPRALDPVPAAHTTQPVSITRPPAAHAARHDPGHLGVRLDSRSVRTGACRVALHGGVRGCMSRERAECAREHAVQPGQRRELVRLVGREHPARIGRAGSASPRCARTASPPPRSRAGTGSPRAAGRSPRRDARRMRPTPRASAFRSSRSARPRTSRGRRPRPLPSSLSRAPPARRSTTSSTPASARWNAMLVPTTPPPTMTTEACSMP